MVIELVYIALNNVVNSVETRKENIVTWIWSIHMVLVSFKLYMNKSNVVKACRSAQTIKEEQ